MVQRSGTGHRRPWDRAKLSRVLGAGLPRHTAMRSLAHLEVDTRRRPRCIRPSAVVVCGFHDVRGRDDLWHSCGGVGDFRSGPGSVDSTNIWEIKNFLSIVRLFTATDHLILDRTSPGLSLNVNDYFGANHNSPWYDITNTGGAGDQSILLLASHKHSEYLGSLTDRRPDTSSLS